MCERPETRRRNRSPEYAEVETLTDRGYWIEPQEWGRTLSDPTLHDGGKGDGSVQDCRAGKPVVVLGETLCWMMS